MPQHHIVRPITEALRHRRLARGISTKEIERKTGMNRSTLRNHENVKFTALVMLENWARALDYQLVLIDTERIK